MKGILAMTYRIEELYNCTFESDIYYVKSKDAPPDRPGPQPLEVVNFRGKTVQEVETYMNLQIPLTRLRENLEKDQPTAWFLERHPVFFGQEFEKYVKDVAIEQMIGGMVTALRLTAQLQVTPILFPKIMM